MRWLRPGPRSAVARAVRGSHRTRFCSESEAPEGSGAAPSGRGGRSAGRSGAGGDPAAVSPSLRTASNEIAAGAGRSAELTPRLQALGPLVLTTSAWAARGSPEPQPRAGWGATARKRGAADNCADHGPGRLTFSFARASRVGTRTGDPGIELGVDRVTEVARDKHSARGTASRPGGPSSRGKGSGQDSPSPPPAPSGASPSRLGSKAMLSPETSREVFALVPVPEKYF